MDINRKRARDIMREKLDVLYKGELSEVVVKKKESELRKQEKRRKANTNLERKRLFKEALAADSKPESETVWNIHVEYVINKLDCPVYACMANFGDLI